MKQRWTRRKFGRAMAAAGLAGAAAFAWRPRRAVAAKARVVVVGGGPAGGTVARYLARESDAVAVTLVEPNRAYTTRFFSNLTLGEFRSLDSITHRYDRLTGDYGVALVEARAEAIDADKRQLRLDNGDSLSYDRLVVAPGVEFDFDAIEGYDQAAAEVMPHAWGGADQVALLKRQLAAMPDGGSFLIAPPQTPYSCPPAPYERVCMVAHYLKQRKPGSSIVVLDSKDSFSAQKLFEDAWLRFYEDMIEWLPAEMTGGVQRVDPASMTVWAEDEAFEVAVANIIPPQRAGRIAQAAGLADATGWCPVHPESLESRLRPGIHVVGDAILPGDMPKSGVAANSQARVCAGAILAQLTGSEPPEPRFTGTCYSLLAADHAIRISGSYEARGESFGKIESAVSRDDESDEARAETAREAERWYAEISRDIFG